MCVLGSRAQFCVNDKLKEKIERKETTKSLDESCKDLRATFDCYYGRNNRLKPLVTAMDKMTVWDIEDAVMLGECTACGRIYCVLFDCCLWCTVLIVDDC